MFKRPVFWIVYCLVSVLCVGVAIKYFPRAFPIVNLDLKMNRQEAVQKAADLAERLGLGPKEYRVASTFALDAPVRDYVELEAGGSDRFSKMLTGSLYSPYTWRVRHFKEGETNEALFYFTPGGEPYGFAERLPEDEPGPDLPVDAALSIAEASAEREWGVDLSVYDLIEKSRQVQTGGRVDQAFVYERPDTELKEGRYRLRLVVKGDKLKALSHFVKIPEAFSRRYEEMRSTNDTIATATVVVVALLYGLGGCVVGLFFLLRQRWVVWRKPLVFGFAVSFVQVLATINNWPLLWMSYDTSLSSHTFFLQQIVMMGAMFVGMGTVFSLSFMAAESLTRKAFPHHIQFWRLWSDDVSGTSAVLGRTIGGYLFVGLEWAFIVGLYLFTTHVLGWWAPSDTLFHPDALASYFPWLTSIAISLQAGFWEECLFRAVPLAGAVLIGRRFGAQRLWIVAAFVIQAVIFGAGHANYAQQPAYARIVELFIPSIVWGLIYLRFGLLPVILLHFAFDVVGFAIPLFVSSMPGLWIDRAMVIILALVPLFIVIRARVRNSQWVDLREEHLNRTWSPEPERETEDVPLVEEERPRTDLRAPWLVIAGTVCIVLWLSLTDPFQQNAPSLSIDRNDVEAMAQQALEERNIELSDEWRLVSGVMWPMGTADRFVWQEGGEQIYAGLMGTFLPPPSWFARFVRFEGDVAERAEEYQLNMSKKGVIDRYIHILPEARPGARISEDDARRIAHASLREQYGYEPSSLKEISVVPRKLPERRDWKLVFAEVANYPLEMGEARIAVWIAGDKIVDSTRYIHVPEEWARSERDQSGKVRVAGILSQGAMALLVLAGVIWAIVNWSRGSFSTASFLTFFLLLVVCGVVNLLNGWPAIVSLFSTSQPYRNQVLTALGPGSLGLLAAAASSALIVGMVHHNRVKRAPFQKMPPIIPGLALGCAVVLVEAVMGKIAPSLAPLWGSISAAGDYSPVVGTAIGPITQYVARTALFLLVFTTADRITKGWTQKKGLLTGAFVLLGFAYSGTLINSLPMWLLAGPQTAAVLFLTYFLIRRFHISLLPWTLAVMSMSLLLRKCVLNPYPGALPGAILGAILLAALAMYWEKRLSE